MDNYIFDYSKLRGKIVEHFGTVKKFAEAMKLSEVSMSNKLTNKTDFSSSEIYLASQLLGIQENAWVYFFTTKSEF